MLTIARNFPLLILPLLVYNAFTLGIVSVSGALWPEAVIRVDMISGGTFELTRGGLLIVAALLLLFIELVKATRTAKSTIVDHLLSTLVFIAYLVQFIIDPAAATTTFFICMVIAFLDVVAGYTISIRVASRDFTVGDAL